MPSKPKVLKVELLLDNSHALAAIGEVEKALIRVQKLGKKISPRGLQILDRDPKNLHKR